MQQYSSLQINQVYCVGVGVLVEVGVLVAVGVFVGVRVDVGQVAVVVIQDPACASVPKASSGRTLQVKVVPSAGVIAMSHGILRLRFLVVLLQYQSGVGVVAPGAEKIPLFVHWRK